MNNEGNIEIRGVTVYWIDKDYWFDIGKDHFTSKLEINHEQTLRRAEGTIIKAKGIKFK